MIERDSSFLDWATHHLFSCPYKSLFGVDCPGCGLQRSVLFLFKGDFITSLKLYPATIPLILIVLFTIAHLKFDFKFGAQFIKILYIGIGSIILINYIYKIYNHQL